MLAEHTRDLVEQIFRQAKFIQWLGIELADFGPGWCQTRLRHADNLLQQHGSVHAGVLMTLADHTCGGAAATTVAEGKDVITVENKIMFLRPAMGGELACRAEVLRSGKNLIFVEAETSVKRNGKAVMVTKMSSTLAIIDRRTP